MDYSEVNKRRNFTEFWSVLVDWPTWPQDIVSSAGMLWHAWGSYWCFVIFPFVFHQILWVFCYFIVKIRCMVFVCIKFWLGGRFPFSYTLLENIQQNVARWWMISVIKMLLVERYKQCFFALYYQVVICPFAGIHYLSHYTPRPPSHQYMFPVWVKLCCLTNSCDLYFDVLVPYP